MVYFFQPKLILKAFSKLYFCSEQSFLHGTREHLAKYSFIRTRMKNLGLTITCYIIFNFLICISHLYFILDIFTAAGLSLALHKSESLFETIVKSCERDFIISTLESQIFVNKSLDLQFRVNQFIDRVSTFSSDNMDIFLCVMYKDGDLLLQNCAKYLSNKHYGEQYLKYNALTNTFNSRNSSTVSSVNQCLYL